MKGMCHISISFCYSRILRDLNHVFFKLSRVCYYTATENLITGSAPDKNSNKPISISIQQATHNKTTKTGILLNTHKFWIFFVLVVLLMDSRGVLAVKDLWIHFIHYLAKACSSVNWRYKLKSNRSNWKHYSGLCTKRQSRNWDNFLANPAEGQNTNFL